MKTAYVHDPLFLRYDTETGDLERGAMLIPVQEMISAQEWHQSLQQLKSKPADRKRIELVHNPGYALGIQKVYDSGESLIDNSDVAVLTESWDAREGGANLTPFH